MREATTFIILALGLVIFGFLIMHLRRKLRYARWIRRGHSDYSQAPPRGIFG